MNARLELAGSEAVGLRIASELGISGRRRDVRSFEVIWFPHDTQLPASAIGASLANAIRLTHVWVRTVHLRVSTIYTVIDQNNRFLYSVVSSHPPTGSNLAIDTGNYKSRINNIPSSSDSSIILSSTTSCLGSCSSSPSFSPEIFCDSSRLSACCAWSRWSCNNRYSSNCSALRTSLQVIPWASWSRAGRKATSLHNRGVYITMR